MLEKDFYNKIGFIKLSEIQEKSMRSDKNTLVLGSCGSGKTEMALAKLLKWDSKSLLIEPMRTLATSLKDRLNEYSNILGIDQWTIQHSSASEDKFLSNKYCVTTIDQVLAGYLGIGKQSFIKGKNILMSNLVFDEVQLFDTEKMLLTTINMLDEIYRLGNKFIIMTATMPEYLIEFLRDRYDMNVIISETVRVEDRKNTVEYVDTIDYHKIDVCTEKQIIICNTTKTQKEIYNNIINKDRIIVLNSNFLDKDREKIEADVIKYFGKNSKNNNKILLTTQIVEAGMDISANIVYSENCPIDNLVQRDGRCARWGGNGRLIVFIKECIVYNEEIIKATNEKIKDNNKIEFSWNIQKEWINEILNPFYEKNVNVESLKDNKKNFKESNKSKLIRDIQNVSIVIKNGEIEPEDFKRESIGVALYKLKEIEKDNTLNILNKGRVEQVGFNKIENGIAVVINGKNCIYDILGFRYEASTSKNDSYIEDFPFSEDKKIEFEDYIEETWLEHAISVKDVFRKRLEEENFNDYIKTNIDEISFYGGMHDLGKLDIEWLKKCDGRTLAHFPFTTKRGAYRDHAAIGYYNIKDHTDKIISNLVLQHHKRYPVIKGLKNETTPWEFHKDTKNILRKYGFTNNIIQTSDIKTIKNSDIITPYSSEWITFLYLTGTLMECEIEAIKNHINNKKEKFNY